ncbi:MAG TPA: hypothetical protein VL326_03875 [Kofleriaceae bacterium]|nr:hypothetical protein [Kofleriaceae bacterium]
MREADERKQHQAGEIEAPALQQKVPDSADHQTRFSSQGPFPEVAQTESVTKPTASDRAYDEVRAAAPETWPQVLREFYWKFPQAARLIAAEPSSCKFVKECQDQGAKFGGWAETGPGANAWPYTHHDTVYIPKAQEDGLHAMSSFLFELNNAVRYPRFDALESQAKKGAKGGLDAKSYARKNVELEVEGMLKLGEVWLAAKKEAGKSNDKDWAAHDHQFYLQRYLDYQAGKITKEDIVNGVLSSKYPSGDYAGKTVEEFYSDQYNAWNKPAPTTGTELMRP